MGMLLRRYHPNAADIYKKGETTSIADVTPELTNVAVEDGPKDIEATTEAIAPKQRGRPKKKES